MNVKILFKTIVFLLLITLAILFSFPLVRDWKAAKTKRDLPEIKAKKILAVVTEYNSRDFYVEGDSIAGFQYDLCKYIAQRSGLTVQIFLENDLKTAIQKLENNKYDVIAQNIPITNENKQYLAFTVPIAQNKQVLVQRIPSDTDSVAFVDNQLDLANKTVYVTKDSPSILRIKHLAEEIAEPIHIEEIAGCTSEHLIYMVAKKEIDYAVVDKEIASKNAQLFSGLDFNTDISFTQLQAWALRKNAPVLLDSLNVWIMAFKMGKK